MMTLPTKEVVYGINSPKQQKGIPGEVLLSGDSLLLGLAALAEPLKPFADKIARNACSDRG